MLAEGCCLHRALPASAMAVSVQWVLCVGWSHKVPSCPGSCWLQCDLPGEICVVRLPRASLPDTITFLSFLTSLHYLFIFLSPGLSSNALQRSRAKFSK